MNGWARRVGGERWLGRGVLAGAATLGMVFSAPAAAGPFATYSVTAQVDLTIVSLVGPAGWLVEVPELFGVQTDGIASALVQSTVELGEEDLPYEGPARLQDSLLLSSFSSGEAGVGAGTSSAFLQAGGVLFTLPELVSEATVGVNFNYLLVASVDATAGAQASGYGQVGLYLYSPSEEPEIDPVTLAQATVALASRGAGLFVSELPGGELFQVTLREGDYLFAIVSTSGEGSSIAEVPAPGTLLLLGAGGVVMAIRGRRRDD